MADTNVEVKKAPAAAVTSQAPVVDIWNSLRNELDRVFERFSSPFAMPSIRQFAPARRLESSFSFAAPAMDVAENDKAYKITAELPGIEPKNVEVTVSGDTLTVKGEKRQEKEEKEDNYYLSERSYGSFQRSFTLPAGVDRDKVSSELAKGVLTITLPKTAESQLQQKKIEVKAA